jgi:hypothetical protein
MPKTIAEGSRHTPAASLPLLCPFRQVVFQLEGESVVACTWRLINNLYGKHTGQTMQLHEVSFFMDWGYWNARVFFDLLDRGVVII